jgi:predicted esterase
VNGSALLSDVDDALAFIQSGLEAFLEDAAPGVAIDWNKVMVTGESAGGFLSAHTWLKSSIPLKLVYLRYPMLVHYQRQPGGYGGVPITKEKYLELAQAAVEEVDRVRRSEEHMPIESSLHPPINMPAANIFSSTDRWKNAFEHPDILELLEDRTDRPLTRPKILIVHGKRDVACLIEHSFKFKKVVENRGWLNEEVDVVAVSDMDHGFDYDLQTSADGFEWLAEVVSKVRDAWIGDI